MRNTIILRVWVGRRRFQLARPATGETASDVMGYASRALFDRHTCTIDILVIDADAPASLLVGFFQSVFRRSTVTLPTIRICRR